MERRRASASSADCTRTPTPHSSPTGISRRPLFTRCTPIFRAAASRGDEEPIVNYVIRAGRLIDGVSDRPQSDVSILVENDRIVAVGRGISAPPLFEVIDLSAYTVLPGLIDAHT